MELKEIRPVARGHFLARYDLRYALPDGREKLYEIVTRTPVRTAQDLPGSPADGVVLIVLNAARTRVLLNQEFRPAVNDWVYNFPAGLIDPGETPQQAAARELWEETGLRLTACLASYGKSYGAVGLSNESSAVLVGQADDTAPFGGKHDPMEEIIPRWVSRQEAEAIAQSGAVTARVQLFLALWGSGLAAL